MRSDEDLRQALLSSHNEARASFGDDRVFIERYITEARHIEIQVMGDKHGHVVWLGERECSIQRRHQKVIEETPSPFLDEKTRAAMGKQAVALATAAGYDSAGTVEFVVDGARNFYFLEMNARLQVEHAVTELVTGLDLVELMIRSAAGEALPFTQAEIKPKGWALETRVYAEDPYRGFLPSTGRLSRLQLPPEGARGEATLRVDTGVVEGDNVTIHYDPMIAKICTHAATRAGAIAAMADALDETVIFGIRHNIDFLNALMHHPRFRDGRLSTAFIAEEYPNGFRGRPLDAEAKRRFVAAAALAKLARTKRACGISGTLNGPHIAASAFTAEIDGERFDIQDAVLHEGRFFARIAGEPYAAASDWRPGLEVLRLHDGKRDYAMQIERMAGSIAWHKGACAPLSACVRRAQRNSPASCRRRRKRIRRNSFYARCRGWWFRSMSRSARR